MKLKTKQINLKQMKIDKSAYPPDKEFKKIRKKESDGPAMHIMMCPECGTICASASERSYLPQFTTCDNIECIY